MKENVLVTGAAGFIGSHLVRELMKHDGFNVIAIDDLSGGFKENLPENIDFIKVSVNNIDSIKQLFNKYKFKYVYHLAAYAAEGLSPFIRNFNYTNNLLGSVNLINESVNNNIQCFIFTSSIAVYGENQVPMSEDMFPQPKDPYGISKYAVELDLKSAFDNFGLNYIIFRPHNVYGEFQNIGDKYRNVVGIFMNEMLQDKPLTIFGDGEQQRAFSYIGDIINVLAESAWNHKAYNQVFNIGADQPYTVNELAMEVIKAMGKTSHPLAHLKERNEVKVAYSEHSKVKSFFGNQNLTPLELGLKNMANWVKKVGARKSQEFKNIEIYKNLPLSWGEA